MGAKGSKDGATRRPSQIQQAHSRLWLAFCDAANAQGLRADVAPPNGCRIGGKGNLTVAEAMLLLRGWPYRITSTKQKTVDIAVRTWEGFSSDLSSIVKATTQVGYFDRGKSASRPLLELHYDFETPAQEAHPLFHAQICATSWPEPALAELGMVVPINRVETTQYANARIPTAFMGYAQILVTLAADHLEPSNFRRVVAAARTDDVGITDPSCGFLRGHLEKRPIPHAHAWYDARYLVQEWRDEKRHLHYAAVLREEFSDKDRAKLLAKIMARVGVSSLNDLQIVPR